MRKLIILPFFLVNLIVTGTNYYVKNSGNDSNTGTSDAQAWKNHPWMISWTGSVVLKPGDTVFMKRGNTWSVAYPSGPFMVARQSGNPGSYITTSAYGYGSKPIINISTNSNYPVIYGAGKSFIKIDDLDISHFDANINDSNAQMGILLAWSTDDIPHDWIITNCDIHDCPNLAIHCGPNSYNITIGDSKATSTATPISYSNHIYDCGYGGIMVCGCDPESSNANSYFYYNYIHDINIGGADSENCYGISLSSHSANVIGVSKYSYGRYNCIKNIPAWTGLDIHNGHYVYFQDNYIFNCKVGIGMQARIGTVPEILENIYVDRNIIENPTDHFASEYYFITFAGETTVDASDIYIRNNTFLYKERPTGEEKAIGINARNVDGLVIDGNYFYNGPLGVCYGAIRMNTSEKNVTIKNNFIHNWHYGILFPISTARGNINIYSNIIHSQGVAIGTADVAGDINGDMNFYNNVILVSPTRGYSEPIRFYNSTIPLGSSLKIKNNIIGFTAPYLKSYVIGPSKIAGNFEIDYNVYWNSTSALPFYSDAAKTLTEWNEHNYDLHSLVNINPQFNNLNSFTTSSDFDIKSVSPAINKGLDVGILTDFAGNPISGIPDIGAFEYQPAPAPIPTFLGAVVENTTSSRVELTYNLTLANIVPSSSAFSVQVNSVARAVSSVSISGTKVYLTLSSPVAYGNSVTVSYTKPSTNPLQTSAGGQAASFSSQNVKNNVAAPSAPVLSGAVIENSTPSRLELTYNLTLANIIPATSAFAVSVNSTSRPVTSVSISGTKVNLILSNPVAYGNSVTVSYTKPSTNPLQTSAGGQATSFSAQTVKNNITAPAPVLPVLSGAVIENSTPARLELTYNITLASTIPETSAFTVSVNSTSRPVTSVSISGTKVYLTLSSPVAYGNSVTVSYTKPSTNPLQTSAGGQAASYSLQPVTNRVDEINIAPVVVVTSPEKSYSGFVNEISAGKSYDINKDILTYSWSTPSIVPISSTSGHTINFLGPIVTEPTIIEFDLRVSDGKTTKSVTVPVEIIPYNPDLEEAIIVNVEASSFKSPNNPIYAVDGDMRTMWSANGTDQWLIVELKDLFTIQHIKIAFQPEQKVESYFELLASNDNTKWESVLTKTKSCGFSGNLHVFDFPPSRTSKEFKYLKLIGLGNSDNPWNYISELRIFGFRNPDPLLYNNLSVKLYPNPALEKITLRIDDPKIELDLLKIVNLLGKEMFVLELDPDSKEYQIPIDLPEGLYVVLLESKNLTIYTQKLIVR